ncbi:MAG: PfkB family carbohydrate kinase [Actinomycetota bacterium]|nr:PfkB family carbohydrate kinase [Actinomycetota bacterium]
MSAATTPRVIHTAQALVDEIATVDALPPRGGNAVARGFGRFAGGAVTVLVAAARAGAVAVHSGSVGTGPHADLVRATLAAEGIEVSSPVVTGLDTGVCLVILDAEGERTFVTTQGAERHVTARSLASASPSTGDLLCLSGYSLVGPTCDPVLALLDGLGDDVVVVLDPGAPFAGLPERLRARVLARTDLWTGNAQEAADLTGRPAPARAVEVLAAALRPGALAVVRDGAAGAHVHTGSETIAVPGFPREAVDTNGAGDTHTGVLLAELARGTSLREAVVRANAAAALKVVRRGPATAPTRTEVDELLATSRAWEPRTTFPSS